MNVFRTVVLFLLLVLTCAMVAIAYFLYQIHNGSDTTNSVSSPESAVPGTEESLRANEGTSMADSVPASGFSIDISTLPEAQQGVLKTLGYTDTITFTPAMISCAEGKLGAARLDEIKNGAAPSMLESASLMGCL